MKRPLWQRALWRANWDKSGPYLYLEPTWLGLFVAACARVIGRVRRWIR